MPYKCAWCNKLIGGDTAIVGTRMGLVFCDDGKDITYDNSRRVEDQTEARLWGAAHSIGMMLQRVPVSELDKYVEE
jgi:hypothetical protein